MRSPSIFHRNFFVVWSVIALCFVQHFAFVRLENRSHVINNAAVYYTLHCDTQKKWIAFCFIIIIFVRI